ncbi:MAG TPA: hypothetical protein VGO47_06830 [Chlamydiales bacterium]|jgi:hypothetical protein|nr:hypothetical protein [Chlamydiales bacterium]
MNWNYKTWSPRKQLVFYVILIIFFVFLFNHKVWAEETVGEHLKEAVFDTLSGAAMTIAVIESTALGNPYSGAILSVLATREFLHAYQEAVAAWNMYFDASDNDDRNISPMEAQMEHGRD